MPPLVTGSPYFWIAYVAAAFQGQNAGLNDRDADPMAQSGGSWVEAPAAGVVFGSTLSSSAPWTFGIGGNGAWIFMETMRDGVATSGSTDPTYYGRTVAHELGHMLGLAHWDDVTNPLTSSLMAPLSTNQTSDFSAVQIHLIRSRFEALYH
jgi:hypothetical protein